MYIYKQIHVYISIIIREPFPQFPSLSTLSSSLLLELNFVSLLWFSVLACSPYWCRILIILVIYFLAYVMFSLSQIPKQLSLCSLIQSQKMEPLLQFRCPIACQLSLTIAREKRRYVLMFLDYWDSNLCNKP